MGNYYIEFDTTPASVVAALKAQMLNSTDWTNIAGGTGHVMSATTTRGAQMAIDLSDAAATSRTLQLGIYRTYSGTGVDKQTRYVNWHPVSAGATTDPIHVMLSLGKDHLFFAIEGPRPGEPNPDDGATVGSTRQCLFLGDIVPYFAGDSVAALALVANTVNGAQSTNGELIYVSRNAANNASWVNAKLATLAHPAMQFGTALPWNAAQRTALGDSNTYLWPYVVIEDVAGIRGRLNKAFFAGFNRTGSTITADFPPPLYQRLVYNSENFVLLAPHRGTGSANSRSGFGHVLISGANYTDSPVVALPTP